MTPAEARAIQAHLRARVCLCNEHGPIRRIAGVDCGFEDGGRVTRAAVSVFLYPELEPETTVIARRPTSFPYVPGLLSFREAPAILEALSRLATPPDLLLVDGQGIAHPRRMGIATHLGIWLDMPTVGVGKSRLIGSARAPGLARGSAEPLLDGKERIGTVLRTRTGVKPLYVSPGHRVSHEGAVDWVMRTTTRYRLPEPVRKADRVASRQRGGGK